MKKRLGPIAAPIPGCRLCHSTSLIRILSLGNQHVSDFVTAKGDSPQAPLELVRCTSCNLVQLKHTFPRESLYRHYWYRSGISSTMRRALDDIVVKACKIAHPKTGDIVMDIVKCLDDRGIWVIQQNYLCSMLEQNGFDNIGHEHLTYYSLGTMNALLSRHNLGIFGVERNDVNGGSFRTYIARRGQFQVRGSVDKTAEYEAKLFSRKPSIYTTFAENVQRVRSQLRGFIRDQVQSGKTVYVYGASTRGNTILQYCELDHRLIKRATDANPEKWGRKTPGTKIPIVSKVEARKDKPDYFLVLPHHFLREITKEENGYLESGGKFIIPLPNFRIVTKSTKDPQSSSKKSNSKS